MGNEADIERISTAFAEFMTPDENGEPLLYIKDLKHVLIHAELPTSIIPKVTPLMDPESSGKITFENFLNVCQNIYGESYSDPPANRGCTEDEIIDNVKDERSDDYNEYEDDEDDNNDDDDDDDDDYVDPAVYQQSTRDPPLRNAFMDNVFDKLSQGQPRITIESLESIGRLINLQVPRFDLEKMLAKASTREEFYKIWKQLE